MNQKTPSSIKNLIDINNPTNYLYYLITKGIKEYTLTEHYLQVNHPDSSQGWIIYISIWKSHFPKIIDPLLTFLLMHNFTFKIPIDSSIHDMINHSNLGYSNQGKIIIIFPNKDTDLPKLLSHLGNFTIGLKGTNIPSAIKIGHLIYTKYGSYESTEPKSIIDPMGKRITDLELIPPQLYPWLTWPFPQIKLTKRSTGQRIIHNKYFIKSIIKNDAKGFVTKTLYQKNLITYKTSILKEGKGGMLEDDFGRDIGDRLEWQYQLHKKLENLIPIPKVIDIFKENDNTYLALEFIKGSSLGTYLGEIFNGNQWVDLKTPEKITIVKILIKINEIINLVHEQKYVHRDINPENFIVTNNQKIWLIDLELTYDFHNRIPNPPFEKGTEGYMSPEQFLKEEPTIEQDYYSLGSLLVMCITQFSPYRINRNNKERLKSTLNFFIDDEEIIELIILCYHENPKIRPSPKRIINSLQDYIIRITDFENKSNLNFKIEKNNLKQFIDNALKTLSNPKMLNTNGIWLSPVSPTENAIGNIRLDRTVFLGMRKGISGILMLLSEAKKEGFNVNSCKDVIEANWKYLKNAIRYKDNLQLGLYSGLAGVAFSINSMIKNSLIQINEENKNIITDCFEMLPSTLDISSGIAGYGLALLKCSSNLSDIFLNDHLNQCIDNILKQQLPNGAWIIDKKNDKPIIITGFDHGIAGIIFFLLNYADLLNNRIIKTKAFLALDYLKSSVIKYQKNYVFPIAIGRKEVYQFSTGDYLILRPFIKAYKMTKNNSYKIFTERILESYPKHISADWLSQEGGLAGLGEVYLDSWLAFDNYEWFKRAEWIASILIQYAYDTGNNTYWIQEIPHYPSADFLTGNSGIVHFLLRFYSKSKYIHFVLDL